MRSQVTLDQTSRKSKIGQLPSMALLGKIPKSSTQFAPPLPSTFPNHAKTQRDTGWFPPTHLPGCRRQSPPLGDRFPLHCSQVNKDGGDPRPKALSLPPTHRVIPQQREAFKRKKKKVNVRRAVDLKSGILSVICLSGRGRSSQNKDWVAELPKLLGNVSVR